MTKKWNIVNDQSKTNSAELLKSNLCNGNDACILVRDNITVIGCNNGTRVAFTNSTTFPKCIRKIIGTKIDDSEDLGLVMLIYNLIECSSDYSDTTGSLWFNSKDEVANFKNDIVTANNFKSFIIFLLGNTVADEGMKKQSQSCAIKLDK